MKEGRIRNWLEQNTELPEELLYGQSLIEIMGQRRVLIENHCGVKEYRRDKICIKLKKGTVLIQGDFLELSQMTKSQLIIHGTISSVILRGVSS